MCVRYSTDPGLRVQDANGMSNPVRKNINLRGNNNDVLYR